MDANKYNVGPGDLVTNGHRTGVAMTAVRTALVYDAEDRELFRQGLEGGTAIQVVDVLVDCAKCRWNIDGAFRIVSKFQIESQITG